MSTQHQQQAAESTTRQRSNIGRSDGPSVRRIITGLGATLVIALVLIGVPAVLVVLFGNPLPTPGDIAAAARLEPDWGNRTLLHVVLPCATWIAWALFACPLVAELITRITGIRLNAARPLLRSQHRLASALVTAALFTAIAPTVTGVVPTAHPRASAALLGSEVDFGPSNMREITNTVNETGLSIATPPPARQRSYRVKIGDTLWSVAGRYLGAGRNYPAIVDASTAIEQADGRHLTDPNLILPGWRLDIPPARHAPTSSKALRPASAPTPVTDPNRANLATPTQVPSNVEPATQHPRPEPSTTRAGDNPAPEPAFVASPMAISGGAAGILAAGLLAALRLRRRKQRSTRARGQRIALPAPHAETVEQQMHAIEDPATLDTLHHALTHLQIWAEIGGVALPDLFAIRADNADITIYLAQPAELPPPFQSVYGDNTAWTAARTLFSPPSRPSTTPYPALVTIGTDQDGGLLLLDLEQLHVLTITSTDRTLAHAFLNGIAAELASVPWANDIHLSLVGIPADLPFTLDPYRIHHVTDVAGLIRDLRTHLADRRQTLLDSDLADVRQARITANDVEAWAPFVVLIGTESTPAEHHELTQLAGQHGPTGLVIIQTCRKATTGSIIELHSPDAASYTSAELDLPPLPFAPQLLSEDTLTATLELFATTDEPATTPPSSTSSFDPQPIHAAPTPAGPPNRDEDAAAADATPSLGATDNRPNDQRTPYLRLLGPVDSINTTGPTPLPGRGTEFLAYLLTHQQPVPGAQIQKALWPNTYDRSNNNTRTLAKQVRSALGHDTDGHLWLPEGRGGTGFTLHPAIRTDWHDFTDLTRGNPTTARTDDLEAALRLVRGQPLLGSDAHQGRWAWQTPLQEETIAAILDTAETLADRALLTHDRRLIRIAARTARLVEPLSELSWQIELRAATETGDPDEIERIINDLYATAGAGEPDYEPDPTTNELIAAGRRASRQQQPR